MKLFQLNGQLNKDFKGAITYTYNLHNDYKNLAINFSFEPKDLGEVTDELLVETRSAYRNNLEAEPDDRMIEETLKYIATDMNVLVFLDDEFLGATHQHDNTKHIYISDTEASSGFLPHKINQGMLKIVISVLTVVNDNTNYSLEVTADEY